MKFIDMFAGIGGFRSGLEQAGHRECWRLQGFSDEKFDKAKNAGVSNSQLYKQAGNAVTVPVVRAIGKSLRKMK